MNDQNSSHHSNNSLENILKELEQRFGAESDQEEKSSSSKRNKAINFKHFSQSQILGGLTLVLLVVGAAVGVYLGQTNQELRQQASNAYPQCSNTTGACDGVAAGGRCIGLAGTCQNSETSANCTCVPDQATPTTQACVQDGNSCGSGSVCCGGVSKCIGGTCQAQWCDRNGPGTTQCGDVPVNSSCGNGGHCSPTTVDQANAECVCTGGGPNPTAVPPTRTPSPLPTLPPNCTCSQNGQGSCGAVGGCAEGSRHIFITCTPANCGPSEACVPDPTCTSPTSVPPTSPPGATATRTPTRTPTTVPISTTPAPTCNGITITYGTTTEPNRPVRIGDIITFTCGAIAGANHYEFRIGLNGNLLQNIAAISAGSRVSQPFTIAQSGTYGAQCRMCTDSTATSCQPWETLQ